MKSRRVFLILSALLSVISVGIGAQNNYVPKADDELYGTWTNKSKYYGSEVHPQRKVVSAKWDKIVAKDYLIDSDTDPGEEITFQIDSKWTDSQGNIWYRTFGTTTSGEFLGLNWQALDRLSESAKVWERVSTLLPLNGKFDPALYPKEIDPGDRHYSIHYRLIAAQEE